MAEAVHGSEIKPPARPPSEPPREPLNKRDREVLAAIRAGEKYQVIADRFGVSAQTISKIGMKYGERRRAEAGAEPRPFIGSPGAKGPGEKAAATRVAKQRDEQIVTLFAVGFSSVYSLIAQFEGAHWELEDNEADEAAVELKKCLDTLEGSEDYERAIQWLSRIAPWASFGATLWLITKPRIEQTARERAAREAVERDKRERAASFRVVTGGQNSGPVPEAGYQTPSIGGDEPVGQTAFPDAI